MANSYFQQFFWTKHKMPVLIDCNFVVDHANGNGLGIRSLKGQGVANVFMNTSATPGSNNGYLNPNPEAGLIMVQLSDNYNRNYSGFHAIVSPVSGTPVTSTTQGLAYTIVSLGTTTTDQWVAAGLPIGMVPAVGASFIAIATGAIGGTGAVEVPAAAGSGITNIETVGDPNQTIAPVGTPGLGATIILQCLKNTVLTAPADNSVISLAFYLSNSSVQVAGE